MGGGREMRMEREQGPAYTECLAKAFKAGEWWGPSHPEKAHPDCCVSEGWEVGRAGTWK